MTGAESNDKALAAFARASRLVSTLPPGGPGLFNPWRDSCRFDSPDNGPSQRLDRLAAHLDCDPRFILMNYSNQVAERLDGVSQGANPAAASS